MISMRRTIPISLFALFAAWHVVAQQSGDSTLKGSSIEVIQSYKPEIKPAPKPLFSPELPPVDTTRPRFTYKVPQQPLYYTYSSMPLRPLALGKDTVVHTYPTDIRVGGGNLSTLFLNAGTSALKGDNFESAIHVYHLSQKGNIAYQQSSLNRANADVHAAVDGSLDNFYYYGYNHNFYEPADSLKQAYTTLKLSVDLHRHEDGYGKLEYAPAIAASVYGARYNISELSEAFDVPFFYALDTNVRLQATLQGNLTQLHYDGHTTGNNLVMLAPGAIITDHNFVWRLFLKPAIGKDQVYLLEDLSIAYSNPSMIVDAAAGWKSNVRQNTYQQLTTDNPYIFQPNNTSFYATRQTRTDEVYLNLQGYAGSHLSYVLRPSWRNYENLPEFLNNYGDQKQFYLLYDKVEALNLELNVRYQVAKAFSIGADGSYTRFFNGSQLHVWGTPSTKLEGDLQFSPFSKLTVRGYLQFLDGIYQKNLNGGSVMLSPVLDLGGSAEYAILSRLSGFVQINNILDNKFQRWLGYQAYGLNIYGGLRVKF
jgi:hypothetical protein